MKAKLLKKIRKNFNIKIERESQIDLERSTVNYTDYVLYSKDFRVVYPVYKHLGFMPFVQCFGGCIGLRSSDICQFEETRKIRRNKKRFQSPIHL